eukprot:Platyproteum_vivax@DN7406_c0_g1_i1.p1
MMRLSSVFCLIRNNSSRRCQFLARNLTTLTSVTDLNTKLAPADATLLFDSASRNYVGDKTIWNNYCLMSYDALHSMDAKQLVTVLHSLARVKLRKMSFIARLVKQLLFLKDDLETLQIPRVLRDLVWLESLDDSVLLAFLPLIKKHTPNLPLHLLTVLLSVFAKMGLRKEEDITLICDQILSKCALAEKENEESVEKEYAAREVLDQSAVTTALHALGKLNFPHHPIIPELLKRADRHSYNLDANAIAIQCHALVLLNLEGKEAGALLTQLLTRLPRMRDKLTGDSYNMLKNVVICVHYKSLKENLDRTALTDEVQSFFWDLREMRPIKNDAKPSKAGDHIGAVLDHLEVPYKAEYPLGGYVVDFALPNHKVAIEVDGYSHFYLLSKDYTAKSLLKRRVLETLGWKIGRRSQKTEQLGAKP